MTNWAKELNCLDKLRTWKYRDDIIDVNPWKIMIKKNHTCVNIFGNSCCLGRVNEEDI